MLNKTIMPARNKIQKLVAVALILACLPIQAFAYGYHDSSGRPPSVFSTCCCKKLNENNTQVHYECSLHEEECPENSKVYPAQSFDCPSDLIFSKHQ